MDKGDRQINPKPLIPQPPSDNHSNYKIPQPVAKTRKNKERNENNIIDYKNILLTMTGEISSSFIHRNSLTQKQPTITFVEDTEDDDEQFIANMQTIIDKNYKTQDKENLSIRDLQSKSYLSRKKKCPFSDEDQNLMKRFKKSADESEASRVAAQTFCQPKYVVSVCNSDCSTPSTPQIVKRNANGEIFRGNTIQKYVSVDNPGCSTSSTPQIVEHGDTTFSGDAVNCPRAASTPVQKTKSSWLLSEDARVVTGMEIEEIICAQHPLLKRDSL
ncbi:PREDICTED: uncharacterized protein LOC105570507 [Vollenhovia emeryi]|uniref:uncharacterized protein LOC105570507 n=1 Tax=Vollenhovia emeryi TaxID=411798 RepID=UPI0005F3C8C7|nr:PREDICTED: uncharacterized protein LOC105570507 [Vollenhovia emeryi]